MKKLLSVILTIVCVVSLFHVTSETVQAKTGDIRTYSKMDAYKDSIIFVKDYTDGSSKLCRFKTSKGKTTVLASGKTGISSFQVCSSTVYYSSYEKGDKAKTYSVSVTGKNRKKICDGKMEYVDSKYIVYEKQDGLNNKKYYHKEFKTGKVTLLARSTAYSYIKNIKNTLYFRKYDESTKKVELLSMKASDTKLKSVTSDKVDDGLIGCQGEISDIISLQGNVFYQYGTYQGSGGFWYGTLVKISSKGKKTVICKDMIEDSLFYDSTHIYYLNGMESTKNISYNAKTGKKTSYKVPLTENQRYDILGSRTYLLDTAVKNKVTVSRFASGTNKKNLRKNFIKITYKQNARYTYSAGIRKAGSYYLVYVQAIDYNDLNYGWRGNYIGTKWYVADSAGKVLGSL
ncbi:DUF5050 domain-containing protein [[Clostridium] polysaccharolyticum]|uniref:Uncharacterized protein n=1 Tax=[Clostridium] polysaccharolyticum TaxID=29364 RepID=A0A1I0ADZ0_9FIRM|nr:DUF5050 domain-containing protein [[Clostridium] polysaccharolyticum]SES92402.1 protein of unknown function [[Clostridium] polysaccharolyticum]